MEVAFLCMQPRMLAVVCPEHIVICYGQSDCLLRAYE